MELSQKNFLGTDTPEGEAARRVFFSVWYEDFRDYRLDQPLDITEEERILSAMEDTILDIAEIAYIREGLIDYVHSDGAKSHTARLGIAEWAYDTAREVMRGSYDSVKEIEDEADDLAASDAERARELEAEADHV